MTEANAKGMDINMKKKLATLYIIMLVIGILFVIFGALSKIYGLIAIGGFMTVKYCVDLYRNK